MPQGITVVNDWLIGEFNIHMLLYFQLFFH